MRHFADLAHARRAPTRWPRGAAIPPFGLPPRALANQAALKPPYQRGAVLRRTQPTCCTATTSGFASRSPSVLPVESMRPATKKETVHVRIEIVNNPRKEQVGGANGRGLASSAGMAHGAATREAAGRDQREQQSQQREAERGGTTRLPRPPVVLGWARAPAGKPATFSAVNSQLFTRLPNGRVASARGGAAAYRICRQGGGGNSAAHAHTHMHTHTSHAHTDAQKHDAPDNDAPHGPEPEAAQPTPHGTKAWLSAPWRLAQRAATTLRRVGALRSREPAPEATEGTECQPDLPMSVLVQPRLTPHNNPHGHGHGGSS